MSVSLIDKAAHAGKLKFGRRGGDGHRVYRKKWLDEWLSGQAVVYLYAVVFVLAVVGFTAVCLAAAADCDFFHELGLHPHRRG